MTGKIKSEEVSLQVPPVQGTQAPITIPFNRPASLGNEMAFVGEATASGHHSGDGPFTKACSRLLEKTLSVEQALLTTSCTHALEMSAILLNIRQGDEVIVPPFTFVSSANAYVLRGARPVFVDIRPDTLNIDERQIEQKITSRTRAIVVVHYAGVGCEMNEIKELADFHGIPVVEDNAHGLFGSYRGRWLGTFGDLSTLSFHETKNYSCGEGGALLVNDPRYSERAEIIREKGTDRSRFYRGQVDKYTWVDVGSSYLPSDILAAYLLGQLENRVKIQQIRKHIWDSYVDGIKGWAFQRGVRLPHIPPYCEQAYHMFYLRLPTLAARQALIAHLRSKGILAVFHYLPLHLSEVGRAFGGREGDCPVTEFVCDQIVRLPFFNSITDDEIGQVVDAVCSFNF